MKESIKDRNARAHNRSNRLVKEDLIEKKRYREAEIISLSCIDKMNIINLSLVRDFLFIYIK
jgi:hypothetical protein